MIHNGSTQPLFIRRRTRDGWVLADAEGHEVLFPHARLPRDVGDDKSVRVFVLRAADDRFVASERAPKAAAGQFARLRASSTDRDGAWMDWGITPGLFVPQHEQAHPLEPGRWYLVRVARDERTDRLYGSTRIEEFLGNSELTVEEGDAVELIVYDRSDLGLHVIVNGRHRGLVHANEVFKRASLGGPDARPCEARARRRKARHRAAAHRLPEVQ